MIMGGLGWNGVCGQMRISMYVALSNALSCGTQPKPLLLIGDTIGGNANHDSGSQPSNVVE